jgi:flavin-dependent dehydrogenase
MNSAQTKPQYSKERPMRIVIAGGGTAGWMAANLFAKKWLGSQSDDPARPPIEICLVESPVIGIIGVGEGSTPSLKRFFEIIDVPESEWMPRCNATYKVNIKFAGWSPASNIESYSHPFTSQVDTFTYKAFNVNCRTRRYGLDTHVTPADFYLNGVLAAQHRLPIAPDNFPFKVEYGYHFDAYLMGSMLCDMGTKRGVKHIQGKIVEVETASNGDIGALVLENNQKVEGDVFVDCTGFASLLIGKTLNTPFESFSENLFNDSAVVVATDKLETLPLETLSTALSCGWAWRIPLQNRTGNGYVYSSKYITPEKASQELLEHLGLDPATETRHLKMRVGQMSQHWVKNCLAVGLSQGFIEPLEATALHLVQITCEAFIDRFEKGQFTNAHQRAFNEAMHFRFERVRDYIVAHYKLNTRDDTQYWRDNRNNDVMSNHLKSVMSVWYQKQDMASEIERLNLHHHFDVNSWNAIFAGYGVFPDIAPNQPNTGDHYLEQNIGDFLTRCAKNFPKSESMQAH